MFLATVFVKSTVVFIASKCRTIIFAGIYKRPKIDFLEQKVPTKNVFTWIRKKCLGY